MAEFLTTLTFSVPKAYLHITTVCKRTEQRFEAVRGRGKRHVTKGPGIETFFCLQCPSAICSEHQHLYLWFLVDKFKATQNSSVCFHDFELIARFESQNMQIWPFSVENALTPENPTTTTSEIIGYVPLFQRLQSNEYHSNQMDDVQNRLIQCTTFTSRFLWLLKNLIWNVDAIYSHWSLSNPLEFGSKHLLTCWPPDNLGLAIHLDSQLSEMLKTTSRMSTVRIWILWLISFCLRSTSVFMIL